MTMINKKMNTNIKLQLIKIMNNLGKNNAFFQLSSACFTRYYSK